MEKYKDILIQEKDAVNLRVGEDIRGVQESVTGEARREKREGR